MSETLRPEQLSKEGKAAYQRGDYEAAGRTFDAASAAYLASGDHLMAAEARNNSSVAYGKAEAFDLAFAAVEGTPGIFAEAGDIRRQGIALGNLGSALEGLGRNQEAADAYLQSAELLQQAGEDVLRAEVLKSLSALQLRTGRQLEALATMSSGLEGVKKPSPQQRFLRRLLKIPFKMLER